MPRNPPWSRDELILALDLYFRTNVTRLGKTSAEVVELSRSLNALPIHPERTGTYRNPNGVYMKLMNFRRLDPQNDGEGLPHGGRGDERIWEEFSQDRERLHRIVDAIRRNIDDAVTGTQFVDDEIDDKGAPEGRVLQRLHKVRERDRCLVREKKTRALRENGALQCEVCGFIYLDVYSTLGEGFIECHHKVPLHMLEPGTRTRLIDMSLVCANCHRMLHRAGDAMTVENMRNTFFER